MVCCLRFVYDIVGREITKYTVTYGVCIQFWPTLLIVPSTNGNHVQCLGPGGSILCDFWTARVKSINNHIFGILTSRAFNWYMYGSNAIGGDGGLGGVRVFWTPLSAWAHVINQTVQARGVHTHTHIYAHTHARTHAHTQTNNTMTQAKSCCLQQDKHMHMYK